MTARRSVETIAVLGSYAPSLVNFRGPLIAALAGRGHRVVAMAPGIEPSVERQLIALGAEVKPVAIRNGTINPLAMAGSYAALRSAFRQVAPTVVIAYTIQPVTLGAIAAAKLGVSRFVALIEGLGYPFGKLGGPRQTLSRVGASLLYRLALPRSSLVVFLNRDDRSDLRRWRLLPPAKPTLVIDSCGVDLDQFRPAPLPAAPQFIMAARLSRSKGVLDYGAAAAELKRRHPHARFRLAGWIDDSADCIGRDDLDRLQAAGVEFLGKLDDVRPALADSSVLVLPSRYREGVPRSALEAMAMGRPVITYDGPGCRETVVDGETGYLVPAGDVAGLEQAMERLIVDPARIGPLGAAARRLAERRFDARRINRQLIAAAGL